MSETYTTAAAPEPLTLDRLQRVIKKLGPPPSPLWGTTRLRYAPNMRDAARQVAAEFGRGPYGRTLILIEAPMLPPGYMACFRGDELVGLVGPFEKEQHVGHDRALRTPYSKGVVRTDVT